MGQLLWFRAASGEHDEASLLAAARAGDRDAMGVVLTKYAPKLTRLITNLAGRGPDVEDILQQTFVAAISAFPQFRGEARVDTWLSRIAVHVTIDALRKPARRKLVAVADVDTSPGDQALPDAAAATREEMARLRALLDQLTPVRRVAFVLHAVEGRSIDEVAALMGASTMATKSRIFWARRTLLAEARRDPWLSARFGGER
jgi:RNA polymerase sigma-70 factor (ECF subfamily)